MPTYECIKKTVTSGARGRIYLPGDTESFSDDPGKHWALVGGESPKPKAEPDAPKAKAGPKPKAEPDKKD